MIKLTREQILISNTLFDKEGQNFVTPLYKVRYI